MKRKLIVITIAAIALVTIYNLTISKDKYTSADVNSKENTQVESDQEKENSDREISEYIEGEKPLYVDGILVVNKDFGLPSNYIPNDGKLEDDVVEAFEIMKEDAKKDGLTINIRSGYRNYDIQKQLYDDYVRRDGEEAANRYSAVPGFSEHQTGLVIDITTSDTITSIGDWFNNTHQAKWLYENAYKYGFILRYPEGKENITGYKAESWHYRYVGKEHSKYFNMNDLTLEEYLGLY